MLEEKMKYIFYKIIDERKLAGMSKVENKSKHNKYFSKVYGPSRNKKCPPKSKILLQKCTKKI